MLERVKGWFKEPLVQFLAAGLAVFLILGGSDSFDPESNEITVSEPQVRQLAENFAATWRRPPGQQEIDGLIRDFIREEVYYREAIRLGLNENDAIIRRRLRSKMEELTTAEAQAQTASDADLQKLLDASPAKYNSGNKFSFQQIWLGPDGDAAAALAQLKQGGDPTDIGAVISLPARLDGAADDDIDRQFGEGFAQLLAGAKRGEWDGPVTSGFGAHLVKVTDVTLAPPAKLAEVRQRIENDWRAANVAERKEKAFEELLENYDIKIEVEE